MHAHSHGQNGHSHGGQARATNAWRVAAVLALSTVYMLAEVVGGLMTGSLALLADAGHMLSDVASLSLTLFAIWIAQRPATSQRTYGHTRAEILAALAQGVALVAVAVLVVIEGVERLASPVEVMGLGMLLIASGGLLVNLIGLWVLAHGSRDNLNMRGAFLHVLSDTLGSVGAIVAGLAIWQLGWLWADTVASIAISGLVLVSAWYLLREAVDVLMETAPAHLDVDDIGTAMLDVEDVEQVHDLHVWTIGNGEVSLSSHVVARPGVPYAELLSRIHGELAAKFGVQHATIQIEPVGTGEEGAEGCASGCDEPAVLVVAKG